MADAYERPVPRNPQRQRIYKEAKRLKPERWSSEIRNWDRIEEVYLNPEKAKSEPKQNKAA